VVNSIKSFFKVTKDRWSGRGVGLPFFFPHTECLCLQGSWLEWWWNLLELPRVFNSVEGWFFTRFSSFCTAASRIIQSIIILIGQGFRSSVGWYILHLYSFLHLLPLKVTSSDKYVIYLRSISTDVTVTSRLSLYTNSFHDGCPNH